MDGRGRRPLYGRICRCQRKDYDLPKKINIAGIQPMADVIGVDRTTFYRMQTAGSKFHTYTLTEVEGPKKDLRQVVLSRVNSLQAWGRLWGETTAEGKDRRTRNLRQYQIDVGSGTNVPANVPATAQNHPIPTPRQPTRERKTPR